MKSENKSHTTNHRPHHSAEYAYVLWGKNFEETAAIVFATELRYVGLPVKLVGLTSQRALGIRGFALYPDILLSDVLRQRSQVCCIVVPCSLATLHHIHNDPRVRDLFQMGAEDGATFIVSHPDALQLTNTQPPPPSCNVITYDEPDNLIPLARSIAVQIHDPFALA